MMMSIIEHMISSASFSFIERTQTNLRTKIKMLYCDDGQGEILLEIEDPVVTLVRTTEDEWH